MKLYIPTSSLNLDNILSQESIAPKLFYSKRDYGYRSFEFIENLSFQDQIVLMTKIPMFHLDDKIRENYPMIIELDIPDAHLKLYGINILQCIHEFELYSTNKTIYINPNICKFYFFDNKSLMSVNLKLSDSLTVKTRNFYEITLAPKNLFFEWQNSYLPTIKEEISKDDLIKSVSIDNLRNRVKGFLFAYTIGLMQSISNETAKRNKVCRDMYNIISSIINDTKQIPDSFIDNLNSLRYDFDCLDPSKIRLRELYSELFPDTIEAKRIIDYFGEGLLKKTICEKEQINPYVFPKFSLQLSKKEWEQVSLDIKSFDAKHEPVFSTTQIVEIIKTLTLKECKLESLDIPNLVENQKMLFFTLLNDCFFNEWGISLDKVRVDKKQLGDDFAKKVKALVGNDDWEANHKTYFTSLRQNIANATPFYLTASDNIIEQSIAAFLLKGDSVNNLREFLINNGVGDFSLAYGLWGASIGYANMPKTLTNELFNLDNSQHVSEIYSIIHQQVHGIELERQIGSIQKYVTIASGMNQSSEDKLTDIGKLLNKELSSFEYFASRDTKVQDEIIKNFISVGILSLNDWDIQKAESIKWDSQKGQKTLIKIINTDLNKVLPPLMYKSSGNFLDDYDFLSNNKEFIKTFSNSNDWMRDLQWFIESHHPMHKDYNYWRDKPTDNATIIQQFASLHDKKYKKSEMILRTIYKLDEK